MPAIGIELYTLDQIKDNTNKIPDVILNQYNVLYDMYNTGEYYGALLQVKDVLELAIKFPVLIMLDIAVHYVDEADELDQKHIGKRNTYRNLEDFLSDVLSCEISFGSLERFAKGLAELESSIAPSKYRDEFLKVQELLKKVYKLYYNPVGLDGNENISSWRNRVIGHGAVDADLGRVKEDVEVMLKNLNAILTVSDYRDIDITQIGPSYSVSASENKDKLDMEPYVLVNSGFNSGKYVYSYLFESVNRRGQAKLLDYINNHKRVDARLSQILSSISLKLNTKFVSENKLDDYYINPEDEQDIMDMENRLLVRVPAFFEETRKLLAKDKGILLLRSERGTGKTVFSRLIINNFRKDGGNRYKLELQSKNSSAIYKDLGVEKDSLFVCTYNFNNSWMNDRDSFMTALEEALEPGNDRRNRDYGRAQGRFKNTFLNEYPDSDCTGDEYREYRAKVSYEFNSWLRTALERYKADNDDAKLLLVLDGIDEIPASKDTVDVAELIDEETLPENIYILCLMRSECEWNMPDKLKALDLPVVEIDKERFESTLSDYIKSNLQGIAQENVNAIIEKSDKRFIHVQVICDIYKLLCQKNMLCIDNVIADRTNGALNDILCEKDISLLEQYMEIFRGKSKKYYNCLMRLLAVLFWARMPLDLNQLYFLYNCVGDERPDFRFYALLRDLRGFISVARVDDKNVYTIANEEWSNQLNADYFTAMREEVIKNMAVYIDDIMLNSDSWTDYDITLIDTMIENRKLDAVSALKLIEYIDNVLENDIQKFNINAQIYYSVIKKIDSMFEGDHSIFDRGYIFIADNPDLYIYTRYMLRIIQEYIGHDIDYKMGGVSGFKEFLDNLSVAFIDKVECDSRTLNRLLIIFYTEISSLYYNGICAKDILYGFIQQIIYIWIGNSSKCLVSSERNCLLNLLAFMRAIKKKGEIKGLVDDEIAIMGYLKEAFLNENAIFYEVTMHQLELIDSFETDDRSLVSDKINDSKVYLFSVLDDVMSSSAYLEQTKNSFLKHVADFFTPLTHWRSPVDGFCVSAKWSRELVQSKYSNRIPYNVALGSVAYYYFAIRQNFDQSLFLEAIEYIKSIRETVFIGIYNREIALTFYECMIKYEAIKSGIYQGPDSGNLTKDIDGFTNALKKAKEDNCFVDMYTSLAFYINAACYALDEGLNAQAKECLKQIEVIAGSFDEESDNSFSFVKDDLFYHWIFALAKKISDKNNELMMDYLTCLVKMYRYIDSAYSAKIEECSLYCTACLFKGINLENFYTRRKLFCYYDEYQRDEDMGISPNRMVYQVRPSGCSELDDYKDYQDVNDYKLAHQIIDLNSDNCYLYYGRLFIIEKLFNLVMCLDNNNLKSIYSKRKINTSRYGVIGGNYFTLKETLKASQICNDYTKFLSLCDEDIEKAQKRVKQFDSVERNAKCFLRLAQAHYFKSLSAGMRGNHEMRKEEYEEFTKYANKLDVPVSELIAARFNESRLSKRYPIFEIKLEFGGLELW